MARPARTAILQWTTPPIMVPMLIVFAIFIAWLTS